MSQTKWYRTGRVSKERTEKGYIINEEERSNKGGGRYVVTGYVSTKPLEKKELNVKI